MGTVGKDFRLHRTPYKAASAKNIIQLDYFIKEEHRLEILEYCKKSEFFNNNTKTLNKSLEDYKNSDKSIQEYIEGRERHYPRSVRFNI